MHMNFLQATRQLLLGLAVSTGLLFAGPCVWAQTAAPVDAPASAPAAAPAISASTVPAAATGAGDAASINPYGIEALWKNSDAITKTVLLLLALMSMGSWYFLVVKVLEQAKMKREAKKVAQTFWNAPDLEQGVAALSAGSAYHFIAQVGLEASKKHGGLVGRVPLTDWISMGIARSVEKVNSNMQSGLAFLATVGSTSPFVGLFGTVWGIYHALTAIGISGQASIDKVAGPVGEALIMTAIGLAVAVPAVLSYNWLVRRNKAVMDDVRSFGGDLHAVLLGSAAQG